MKRVLVGMSGGVDSSVTAAILKERGYKVIGASMRLWNDEPTEEAQKICDFLGIEYCALDFKDAFREKVVEYFINSYKNGKTPNPCVFCNKFFKFGAMLDYALENGIDFIATGHYARISKDGGLYKLKTSAADKKDQTYFLYNLTQHELSHTLMPLGEFTKDEIHQMADDIKLPAANKPDSQEICFIPDDDYAKFICEYSSYLPKTGDILDIDGNVIGTHKGIIYYTIGQRKGIGAYGRPMFVMNINPKDNTITLGEKGMEFSQTLTADNLNFISGTFPDKPFKAQVKIRCQAPPAEAVLYPEKDKVKVVFDKPQRAITPGQAAVFYDGDTVLGGGLVI